MTCQFQLIYYLWNSHQNGRFRLCDSCDNCVPILFEGVFDCFTHVLPVNGGIKPSGASSKVRGSWEPPFMIAKLIQKLLKGVKKGNYPDKGALVAFCTCCGFVVVSKLSRTATWSRNANSCRKSILIKPAIPKQNILEILWVVMWDLNHRKMDNIQMMGDAIILWCWIKKSFGRGIAESHITFYPI